VLVVDRDACRLWEMYDAHPQNGGASWTAGSGATWDLNQNAMRPLGWTSGDAAGLPILPGLVRYDEVASGTIDHAIRFTAPRTADAYVWPASHKAPTGVASDPPMGAWFRLKSNFDISGFSAQNQVILRALKQHGMVLADNGSSWYMSGAPDPGWNDTDLHALRNVPGFAFEAVDVSSLEMSSTSYAVNGLPQPPPPPSNLIANPDFESSLAGWHAGDPRTTLARNCTSSYGGSCSAQIGRTRSGTAVLDDSPNTVASAPSGATYTGSAWVKAASGWAITLRIREYSGSKVVRSKTVTMIGNGAWQQRNVVSDPAGAGHSISVDVSVAVLATVKALVDDVSLIKN
jgi:hypothetical protein